MTADDAFELSKANWRDNEQDLLKHVIGYQEKVEEAAGKGKTHCVVGIIPMTADSFVLAYFERLGFSVSFQRASEDQATVYLNWNHIVNSSRSYQEEQEFRKSLLK